MKRLEISLFIGIIAAVLLSSFSAFARDAGEMREDMVRLHIIANSDSEADQNLKLMVRDALLEGTAEIFSGGDKSQAESLAAENLSRMENIAREVIIREGYDYEVSARLVNMYFDTRAYGDIRVAAGWYDAVRVTIGSGGGKNWWCVMFPPMCLPAAEERQDSPLERQLEQLGAAPKYSPKFAVVEIIEQIQTSLSGRKEHEISSGDIVE